LVTKVKPKINSVEVHPQLSTVRHPLDGAVVGAGSLWPTPIRELDSGVPLLATTGDGDFCIAVHFFSFRSALSCVSEGSIVIVLAAKGIYRCCFVMFKILVVLLGVAMRVSDLWKSLPSLYHAVCFVFFFLFA
jgi:hypothetical protein